LNEHFPRAFFYPELRKGDLENTEGLSDDLIEIPENMLASGSIIEDIFGNKLTISDIHNFSKLSILCPKNNVIDQINEQVLNILDGENKLYLTADSIDAHSDINETDYPSELLHELTPSGMSPHKLNFTESWNLSSRSSV